MPIPERLDETISEGVKYLPTFDEFGFKEEEFIDADDRAALPFIGGEDAGLARLKDYIWEYQGMRNYKDTRNGFLGPNFSAKFSPWMANGCLSPRFIYF